MAAPDNLISILMYGLVFFGVGLIIKPVIENFLTNHGFLRKNYKQEMIPTAFGIFLYIMLLVQLLYVFIWPKVVTSLVLNDHQISLVLFIIWAGIVTWVGWIDDTKGNRTIKGFTGHIESLLRDGHVTTGLVKAITIGMVAIWVVWKLGNVWYEGIVQFTVLVLSTNAVNLLDLRPGRAIKGFYLGSILLFIGAASLSFISYWLPITMATLFVLPKDLSGKIMLGDTGANLLGFTLGFSFCISSPYSKLLIVSLLLIILHWFSERQSLTSLIERSYVLSSIDRWGRLR